MDLVKETFSKNKSNAIDMHAYNLLATVVQPLFIRGFTEKILMCHTCVLITDMHGSTQI